MGNDPFFRLAHISDLHFGRLNFGLLQFFSKRWLGNLNYLATRKKTFDHKRLNALASLFKKQGITHVIITGDLSVTSSKGEFVKALKFVEFLKQEGLQVFVIPGNHDHYTKRAYQRQYFYRYFDSAFTEGCLYNLKEHKVTYTFLGNDLWLVALDTALATSFSSSQGFFSPQIEHTLEKVLQLIPKRDRILLVNHFPFFEHDAPKKRLLRGKALKELILKHPNILCYLHGHTHRQTVANLRASELPIISDTGSTPEKKEGASHLLEISKEALKLTVYRFKEDWKQSKTYHMDLHDRAEG